MQSLGSSVWGLASEVWGEASKYSTAYILDSGSWLLDSQLSPQSSLLITHYSPQSATVCRPRLKWRVPTGQAAARAYAVELACAASGRSRHGCRIATPLARAGPGTLRGVYTADTPTTRR